MSAKWEGRGAGAPAGRPKHLLRVDLFLYLSCRVGAEYPRGCTRSARLSNSPEITHEIVLRQLDSASARIIASELAAKWAFARFRSTQRVYAENYQTSSLLPRWLAETDLMVKFFLHTASANQIMGNWGLTVCMCKIKALKEKHNAYFRRIVGRFGSNAKGIIELQNGSRR